MNMPFSKLKDQLSEDNWVPVEGETNVFTFEETVFISLSSEKRHISVSTFLDRPDKNEKIFNLRTYELQDSPLYLIEREGPDPLGMCRPLENILLIIYRASFSCVKEALEYHYDDSEKLEACFDKIQSLLTKKS